MSKLYLLAEQGIPDRLHGAHSGYELRNLRQSELVSIEDQFFKQGENKEISREATTVVFPELNIATKSINEARTLVEFALSFLTIEGMTSFNVAATFQHEKCTNCEILHNEHFRARESKFIETIDGLSVIQWIKKCAEAQKSLKERMHITTNRYVRYVRGNNILDALMDLCICLESLIGSQTEISFRFSVCLAKITGDKGESAEQNAKLLSELYTIRSKVAHGDPKAEQLLKKFEPKLPELQVLVKKILTTYVFFMSAYTLEDWKSHLHKSIFI